MKMNLLNCFLAASLFMLLIACEHEEKNARLQVWLTDAPGDYQEVNIDIQGVEIHASEQDNGKGWTALSVNKDVYNLLELTNGIETLLGEIEIPAGKISQIRLKLGNNNTVKVGGEIFDIGTPSGQQSGLKLQIHETLAEGITYKILLDFDVARSVIQTGNGEYKLKPVIRTITEPQNGAIKGVVDPKDAKPAIYAISGDDTLATTYSDSTGHFLLRGLPADTYKLVFDATESFNDTEKSDVVVQIGVVTDVGMIAIVAN